MPRCKAPEVLRSEAYLNVRRNKPAPCVTRGRKRETPQMGVFQQPANDPNASAPGVARSSVSVRHALLQRQVDLKG
jgi:hypothetical protein